MVITFSVLVIDPIDAKIVSKLIVSVEKCKVLLLLVVSKSAFLHEKQMEKINNMSK